MEQKYKTEDVNLVISEVHDYAHATVEWTFKTRDSEFGIIGFEVEVNKITAFTEVEGKERKAEFSSNFKVLVGHGEANRVNYNSGLIPYQVTVEKESILINF